MKERSFKTWGNPIAGEVGYNANWARFPHRRQLTRLKDKAELRATSTWPLRYPVFANENSKLRCSVASHSKTAAKTT
jgi:hypothetical protein